MTNKPLQISVIGVGHLGKLHAKLLKQVPNAELAGVYDVDMAKCSSVAAEIGCRAHESVDDVLIRSNGVIIAATTSAHAELALDAIFQGRHLFVEKPLADSAESAKQVVEAAETAGVKLQVGHIERFNPAFRAIEGVELNPSFIEVHRLAAFDPRGTDVAVVQDLMIHDLDLILKMVSSPVTQIHASGVEVISGGIDIANARLIFDSGCVANITASRLSAKKMRKMRIFQRNGYISLDFLKGEAEIFRLEEGETSSGAMVLGAIDKGVHRRNIVYIKPPAPPVNALLEEQKAFVKAILEDKPVPVTGGEALAAMELSERILGKISEAWS